MKRKDINCRIRCAVGKVTPGTEAPETVINLVKLPKGARILPSSKLYIKKGQNPAMTLKCGDVFNNVRYLTAVAPGANACEIALSGMDTTTYSLVAKSWIFLTSGMAALSKAAISFEIFYVIE